MDNILLSKLITAYSKHNSLIVGVDFDDTIFPFSKSEENVERCRRVVNLLLSLKQEMGVDLVLCLYSVADAQSLVYKEHIMDLYGLKPQYINEGPIDSHWGSKKPFFNILLDDKTGLNDSMKTLEAFKEYVKERVQGSDLPRN